MWRIFLEHAPVALAMFDRKMRYLAVSRQWNEAYHLGRRKLEGLSHYEVFPEIGKHWKAVHRRGLRGEIVRNEEERFVRANGSVQWLCWEVRPWHDTAGAIGGILIFTEDITKRKQAEEALRESNERLGKVLEVETVGVIFWDLTTGRMTDANDTFLRMMGYSRRDVESGALTWQKLTPPEYMDASRAEIRKFQATGRVGPYEKEYFRKDGTKQWLIFAGSSLGGNACIEFCVDISARKKAEVALQESEQRLKLSQQAAKIGTFEWNIQTGLNTWSPELEAMYGLKPGEFARTQPAWQELVHPDDRAAAIDANNWTLRTGEPVEREWRVVWRDGSVHWILGRYQGFKDAAGKPLRLTGVNIDITERKRAERALGESESRYRQLVQGLPVAVCTCDVKGRMVLYNAAAVRLWGQEPDSLGRWDGAYRLFTAEGKPLPHFRSPLALVVKGHEPVRNAEIIIMRPNGGRSRVLAFPDPIRDQQGRIIGAVNVHVDITALTETEAALRRSLHQIRTLSQAVEQSPASVLITTPTGEIDYANPKFTEVTGYTLEEVLGKNPRFLKSGHQSQEFYRDMWNTITAGKEWRGEFCNRRKNGELFWEYAVVAPVFGSEGQVRHFVAIKEDMTEQHQAIDMLRDREERLRAILNTVGDAVITIDRKGHMVGTNPAAQRMFGYAEAEMLGHNVKMLMPPPFRDEHDGYLAKYHRTGRTGIIGTRRELQAQRWDGTIFPIELAVSEATHLNLFTGVIRDLTERKRLEAEVLQISEDERQRVAADLHDGICQELVSINFAATALERDLQPFDAQIAQRVKMLAQTIAAAAGHTREVARGMSPVVDGGDGLMHALRHFASPTAEAYRVRCQFKCPRPVLVEDRLMADQLYRIAQEAVQNAIQHGKAKKIDVSLHLSRGALALSVTDDGHGLSMTAGPAKGLGLRAMSYRARLIGGQLTVQPRSRGGTEVQCRLPAPEKKS